MIFRCRGPVPRPGPPVRTVASDEDRWHRRDAAFVWRSGVPLPIALARVALAGSPSHAPPARAAKPSRGSRRTAAAAALAVAASLTVPAAPAAAAPATVPAHPRLPTKQPVKQAVATGYGGAVSTVDPDASRTALEVLRRGGNAMDAAVAAGATLGVTEPYVAAIGGGGYMTYYDARTRRVHALDGREFAPKRMKQDAFIDPATGRPLPFDQAVTSGLGVGVPGTLAQWDLALRRFGTRDLGTLLRPAIKVADRGFVVDQEFHDQTATNEARFRDIVPTRRAVPAGREGARGRLGLPQPRPRRHLPGTGAARHGLVLPGRARQGDRPDGRQAPGGPEGDAQRPSRPHGAR